MIIVGAKGFAKQLVEIFFQASKTNNLFFFDDYSNDDNDVLFGIKIIKDLEEAKYILKNISDEFCLGVGNPLLRRSLCEKFEKIGGKISTVISPFAHLSFFVKSVGLGCNILTGAIIENDAQIGKGSLININSVIHHDVYIGEFCEISPGAKILGHVYLGDNCTIGTNAVILPNIKIGANSIIGAGAVVNKDVENDATFVGIPAKKMRK